LSQSPGRELDDLRIRMQSIDRYSFHEIILPLPVTRKHPCYT
jgi:hypothetical protein